jgi:glycosyltransferase involved in cell wall biosynthesis
MGKRIKVGIVYSYDENWIGGTYYYQNIIRSFSLLPDERKPHVTILGNQASFNSIDELQYPYVSFYALPNNEKIIYKSRVKKIKQKLFSFLPQRRKNIPPPDMDVLFHPSEIAAPFPVKKHLYWIPDFQEVYLPQYFSAAYLHFRKQTQLELLTAEHHIIFSSFDALSDFKRLYPAATTNCYVVNFAVFHPDFSQVSLSLLREKYNISEPQYFYVPNQFWKHKNHITVLKAALTVKNKYGNNFQLLFSGNESDFRNPEYINELKEYVIENGLNETVRFLGFIERAEQLCLMNHALAIIQPSLFEGWSTVVEDVKAMNQHIIVSDLNVHRDQLGVQAFYFNPNNENELADLLIRFLTNTMERPVFDYSSRLVNFAKDFMRVVEAIV